MLDAGCWMLDTGCPLDESSCPAAAGSGSVGGLILDAG
ncbi:hypothetical protein NC99_10730 [Sunxiuqinia dokdonensis]|uniref:Uncharacterized protein n=1 Tax=Sunxiuqinia dokdonensis TaxID=1409788 RepID=A0A0L8VCD1_9BACT|nr:hypothetical protein NC99_10730 [Sunxiuqinia dokdonensis]